MRRKEREKSIDAMMGLTRFYRRLRGYHVNRYHGICSIVCLARSLLIAARVVLCAVARYSYHVREPDE